MRAGAIVQKWDGCPIVESDTLDNNGSHIVVGGLNKFRVFDEKMKNEEWIFDTNEESRV